MERRESGRERECVKLMVRHRPYVAEYAIEAEADQAQTR